MGLAYICQTYERFYAVGTVLSNMVVQITESQAVRLLKHVVRCYLRLSDNPRLVLVYFSTHSRCHEPWSLFLIFSFPGFPPNRAREALRACLPGPLRDATFSQLLKNDHVSVDLLSNSSLPFSNISPRISCLSFRSQNVAWRLSSSTYLIVSNREGATSQPEPNATSRQNSKSRIIKTFNSTFKFYA